MCGKGVEKVLRWCGKGGKYLLIVYNWFADDPGVIKELLKSDPKI